MRHVKLRPGTSVDADALAAFAECGIVIEAIKQTTKAELAIIKRQLARLDVVNGDARHYFRHLAQALAI